MKVLGINGSPRGANSRTLRLVQAALRGAESGGADTELVDVCDLDIEYCTGCGTCYATGTCVQADDFEEVWAKIQDADGIVLGSPVYIHSVTAQLKTLIDRTADAVHCQLLTGKYGCAVSTTGGGGEQEVIDYMNHYLNMLGAVTVGGVGIALGRHPDGLPATEEKAFALGKDLVQAIAEKRRYPEQEKALAAQREYFRRLVEANRETWTHEYEYWMDRGWM
ncbi:MAG: flavodoxin family protein [Methanomicrobiales archaeon]|nr:flavodoxin family protein [Methanomicrobiales archaeon]MDI6875865.1 flavodoxin family protein [Methanomicrobiales archaeon]